jgi:hypothetical protein
MEWCETRGVRVIGQQHDGVVVYSLPDDMTAAEAASRLSAAASTASGYGAWWWRQSAWAPCRSTKHWAQDRTPTQYTRERSERHHTVVARAEHAHVPGVPVDIEQHRTHAIEGVASVRREQTGDVLQHYCVWAALPHVPQHLPHVSQGGGDVVWLQRAVEQGVLVAREAKQEQVGAWRLARLRRVGG